MEAGRPARDFHSSRNAVSLSRLARNSVTVTVPCRDEQFRFTNAAAVRREIIERIERMQMHYTPTGYHTVAPSACDMQLFHQTAARRML